MTNYQTLQPMFDDLYEFGVDILLEGHDHIYERLEPIKSGATPSSPPVADPVYGIRQFTVGTGGAALQSCPGTPLSTSDVCNSNTYGVVKFTLHPTTYDWQFLPIAGSTFTDSGTGTVHGAPGDPPANSGLQLTTSSYVTFGDPAKLDLAQFTIETWFKKTGTGTPNTTGNGGITILPLLTHGAPQNEGSSVDANWILGINTSGNVIAADFEGIDDPAPTGQNFPISGTTPIADNVWYHAAATFDGTTFAVYLDGNLEASDTPGFHPRSDTTQHAALGTMIETDGTTTHGRFDGVIDEARVWNVARSGTDILADKNNELTSGTGLVARWGLNEGLGTNVGDSIATVADGTVMGTGYSWVAGFVPPAPDPAPDAPTNLAASVSTDGIGLAWDANSEGDLAGYNVYRSASPGVSTAGSPINTSLIVSPAFTDNNVVDGATYYYVVTAVDTGANESDASNEVSETGIGTGLQLTTSSYVTFGDPAKLDLAQFTIETWFKKTGTGTPNTTGNGGITILPLLTHGAPQNEGSSVDANWILGINTSGNVIAADFEGIDDPAPTGQNFPISGTTPIADNVWYHAAATFDGTTFAVYLDGNLEASDTPGFHPRSDTTQHAALGTMIETDGTTTHGRFDGVIDEARVWNVARSGTDILADKNNELTSGTGLVARWGLNEGLGTNVGDSIATVADGTVMGTGYSWVAGAPVAAAGSNTAPDAPVLNAPGDGATGIGTSPTLDVDVSDPDGDPLTITYYGRPYASGTFAQIAQHTGVTSGGNDTATWSDIGAGQTFEWYATVGDGTATTTGPTWTFHTTPSADPVFVGIGDIGSCDTTDDSATGLIIEGVDGNVFTTGDNVYPNGTTSDFANCYAPTPWGDSSVLSRTRPVPGNHDWGTGVTENLDGYNGYFGAAATDADGNSYYSYDIPSSNWHIVNLDSECQLVPGGCDVGSPQELWLKADLAANSTKNVIALWHKPRFSSGATNYQALQPFWDDLYAAGVDILLDGHDHIYERFAPMQSGATPADPPVADPTYGIQQFTVGTGGEEHHALGTTLATSLIRNNTDFGIFKLTLHPSSYDWVFLPISGYTFTDSGTGTVHGAPPISADYYVDNTDVGCSNSGAGSLAVPFCTIGKAASLLTAGQTVRVLAGTYAETVNGANSGSAGNPITYSAAPGVTVTGNGTATGNAFRMSSKSYIVIDGFTITDTVDYGIYASGSNHITISNNHVSSAGSPASGSTRAGIYLNNTDDSTITGNTTDHNSQDGIKLASGSAGNLVSDNVSFANAEEWERNATGIQVIGTGSDNNTLIHNMAYDNEDSGLQFYTGAQNNVVIGNLSYGNGDHGIDNNAAPGNTIVGNTVQGNVTAGINLEGSVSPGSGGATLANNIAVDNGLRLQVGGGTASGQPTNIRVDAQSITGTTLDYDLVDLSSGTSMIQWNGTTYTSLAAFQAAQPTQEVHGLEADPLLATPAAIAQRPASAPFNVAVNVGDYHLTSGSPAIDSADSDASSEPALDIEGQARVDDPATTDTGAGTRTYDDRGAYEFVPSVGNPILSGTVTVLASGDPVAGATVSAWDATTGPGPAPG